MADRYELPLMCSHCGSTRLVPFLYGIPNDKGWRAALLGRVALGGSMWHPDDGGWMCSNCGRHGADTTPSFHDEKLAQIIDETSASPQVPENALDIFGGRIALQNITYRFAGMGASRIKIVKAEAACRFFALMHDGWFEYEVPWESHLREIESAILAQEIPRDVSVKFKTWRVELAQLSPPETGWEIVIYRPPCEGY